MCHKGTPPEERHGNDARIDPKRDVESLYATNRVTVSHRKEDEVPVVPDDSVEYARKFSEENKK